MYTILIDDAIVAAEPLFASLGRTIIVPGREIAQNAHLAEVLIIRSRTQVDTTLLTANPQLRFIGSSVVGLDHIDMAACATHGVQLYTAQGCNARSVAEYVIAQIVAHAVALDQPLHTLTLAIVGVGQVGRQLQALAQTLGLRLLLNDPYRADQEANFPHTPLEQCLTQANIISLHTPLTTSGCYASYQLLNRHNLPMLTNNALLINAARGDIVDESALLDCQHITCITDCWSHEPTINRELLAKSRLATPHIAGHAWDAKFRGGTMVAEAFAHWSGQPYKPHTPELPTPAVIHTHEKTALLQLNDCLTQAYSFTQDDQILRQSDSNTLAKHFEDYRRHYPIRREWTGLSVKKQGLTAESSQWLQELGFNLLENANISH